MTTYNSTAAQYPTNNWYDGEDRLVEVQQPRDPNNDAYQNPWTTRYLYDISQGNGVAINPGNVPYKAYGNLYKTQELLPTAAPTTVTTFTAGAGSNPSFADLNGNAFDGLDRPTTRYSFIAQSGTSAETLIQETLTYDQSSYFTGYSRVALLRSARAPNHSNANGITTTPAAHRRKFILAMRCLPTVPQRTILTATRCRSPRLCSVPNTMPTMPMVSRRWTRRRKVAA